MKKILLLVALVACSSSAPPPSPAPEPAITPAPSPAPAPAEGSLQPTEQAPPSPAAPAPAPSPEPTPAPTPTQTRPSPPPVTGGPKVGGKCGPNDECEAPATCIKYYGIAGPRGPQFAQCEIKCDKKSKCPDGKTCRTIADGPGQVCR
ncbi:MAG TPA: hypothetical protein VGC41_24780 [Kofleriaceae bacterium]